MNCPAEFVALAERLADASGKIVRRYFRTSVEIITKADDSPVTIADRETRGKPILGVIDHPAIGERWIGFAGRPTTFQGQPVKVRPCADLGRAVLSASSPHMFGSDEAEAAFHRVRRQAGLTLYGADCYAYGLIASGFHDLVVEANNGIHDFLPLVPVVEGAGGVITDWEGRTLGLHSGDKVLAAGDRRMHEAALKLIQG